MIGDSFERVASGTIRWLTPEEGGRQAPPPGPVYAATARFDPELPNGDVSIVLRYRDSVPATTLERAVDIGFLAPDLVRDRLRPGLLLWVTEGPHKVATCRVEDVEDAEEVMWRTARRPSPERD